MQTTCWIGAGRQGHIEWVVVAEISREFQQGLLDVECSRTFSYRSLVNEIKYITYAYTCSISSTISGLFASKLFRETVTTNVS